MKVEVENIKCGGCANSIEKKLLQIEGVEQVVVDIDGGTVSFRLGEGAGEEVVSEVKAALLKMGYPEVGSAEGLEALGAKAKSFVSCAVGKLDQ